MIEICEESETIGVRIPVEQNIIIHYNHSDGGYIIDHVTSRKNS